MASESVATEVQAAPEKAITEWCDDMQWEALDGTLPMGVWRRLMRAKRSLYAANAIQKMLLKDQLGKNDQRESGAEFVGLPAHEVEALRIAAIELGDQSEELLTEVQDNKYNCCGVKGVRA